MSAEIALLQNSPGRLHQSLHDASLNVWESSNSGMSRGNPARTISYYNKGLIAGLLLDAKIQYATDGRKCLDDVMRLACARYSGATGFTADQFRALAEEVAGTDLTEWFRRTVSSTEELDYSEMLDWYGLEFGPSDDPNARWQLTPRSDASEAQQERLRRLTSPTRRSTDVR
ncbi:MAG TPA: hypothetical protein PLH97_10540, partial [Verrucomicrobiota bacterium]|nr:hypothetical protein [Verrucomicrobiota bacterium]